MIKLKSLLTERIDYHDTAEYLVKQYKLRSKVSIGNVRGGNKADYDWVKDVINLKKSYSSVKEFIITVLHEIDHAKMRKEMGWRKYEKEYTRAGQDAEDKGGDFHDDNEFEEKAESWARKEYSRKWKRKFS
jgi:antirestriction protein ArdC|tara:strand:+ start:183 stop:575 length:393 start_codon:yes stop_codon:yes gene_type:complete